MIIVTGMHRSGTSLVSQLLHEAGFDFGNTKLFYPADRWNIRGYIETAPVMDLNSIFITGVPRTKSGLHAFLSQCIYLTMPDPLRIHKRGLKYSRDIRQTGKIYDKLAVKDPRFCLTLSLWNEYANIDKIVVCVRHPEQVVRSLGHRQRLPRSLALKFWCYHIQSLLESLPADKTFFFDVDSLVAGCGLETLHSALRFLVGDRCQQDPGEILDRVFRKTLMHRTDRPERNLPARARMLWDELNETAYGSYGYGKMALEHNQRGPAV